MTIVGTRPEIIKLSQVIKLLDEHTRHILVHTGQNFDYELNALFFEQLGIRKPDYYLDAAGQNAAATIGNVIVKSDMVMESENPDAVLLYGDTNSCLAVISAKKRKIPVFHMEAGNRCFDQRVPEEINRKIVDHLSDINMTITEHARRYLLDEGLRPETIMKIGSSMKEVLAAHMPEIIASPILAELALEPRRYFLVSIHREENIESESNFHDLLETLEALAEQFKLPLIVSTHPRTRKKLELLERTEWHPLIRFMKPMGFFAYIHLQQSAYCVISDSGTVTEEAAILKFPAITIRQAHERPEGMDEGTLIMSGLKRGRVMEAIRVIAAQYSNPDARKGMLPDYDVETVSYKVLNIILSYTDYINRTVWHK